MNLARGSRTHRESLTVRYLSILYLFLYLLLPENLPVFNYELFDNVLNFGEELLVEINHNSNYASSFDKNLEDKLKTPAAPAAQSQS